jgi:hypothetical protein
LVLIAGGAIHAGDFQTRRIGLPVIINPRGIGGSGKTELARRLMARYGGVSNGDASVAGLGEPIVRPGRAAPIAYRLQHPFGGRPLLVLGRYGGAAGGCDTIRARDGGLPEAFRIARMYLSYGCDILMEGLSLSSEVHETWRLAKEHPVHVLRLDTSLERSVQQLLRRRRAPKSMFGRAAAEAARQDRCVSHACASLQRIARVEVLDFARALGRAEQLLGLAGPSVPAPRSSAGQPAL